MPDDAGQTSPPPAAEPAGLGSRLRKIPLVLRMILYGTFFLAFVLVGLAWLSHRLDVFVPTVHAELGWIRVLGAVLACVCLGIYIRTSYVLTARGRGAFVEFDPPAELVVTGPYRWVRNPIAASLVATILGEALLLSSTGIFVMFLIALLLAHLQVVLLEEPLLRKRFGQPYVDYLRRVPRWIPRRPRGATA